MVPSLRSCWLPRWFLLGLLSPWSLMVTSTVVGCLSDHWSTLSTFSCRNRKHLDDRIKIIFSNFSIYTVIYYFIVLAWYSLRIFVYLKYVVLLNLSCYTHFTTFFIKSYINVFLLFLPLLFFRYYTILKWQSVFLIWHFIEEYFSENVLGINIEYWTNY